MPSEFERSVFVNCPFDEEFRPVLEAILFCVIDCGLSPRIATERLDSGEVRLDKIVSLIRACKYSIHDLSRVQAAEAGEFARLNMPFELGVDFGVASSGSRKYSTKRLLVTANEQYKYQAAISDIAGWDIRSHNNEYATAFRAVRDWLAANGLKAHPAARIEGHYLGFQEWSYERLLDEGWDERDIQQRATPDVLDSMLTWVEVGRPMTY